MMAFTGRFRSAALTLLALLALGPELAAQDLYRIRVDLKEKKTVPESPTVNLNENAPAIAIDFSGDPRSKPPSDQADEFQVGYPGITTYVRVENQPTAITFGDKLFSLGSSHALTIRKCTKWALNDEAVLYYRPRLTSKGQPRTNPPAHLKDQNVEPGMCPFAVLDRRWTNSWTVFTNERTLTFNVQAYIREKDNQGNWKSYFASADQKNSRYVYSVPISLRTAAFSLRWSAGIAWYENQDQQYALRKIAGDADNLLLDRLDDSSNPYQLSALAHYTILRAPAIAISGGVGLDVPVKEPSFMLGMSFTAPTINYLDDAYVTIGVAYSPAEQLKPKFVGLETLPSSTRESDLLETEHDFGGFISLTYGFAGGEKQVKGVFSGTKK